MKIAVVIIFICFVSEAYCKQVNYNKPSINISSGYGIKDTVILKTRIGKVLIVSRCDSFFSSIFKGEGEIYTEALDSVIIESERRKLYTDKIIVTFKVNKAGELIDCFVSETGKLFEFNKLLIAFVSEVNLNYNHQQIVCSLYKKKPAVTVFKIPYYFQLDN